MEGWLRSLFSNKVAPLGRDPGADPAIAASRPDGTSPKPWGRFLAAWALVAGAASTSTQPSFAQTPGLMPLQLESKIQLGDVRGRIDHMAADLSRQRVFVAELGNNSVSAVDLKAGQVAHRWSGLKAPQGVAYVPAVETLYAANGGDGSVRLFNGEGDAERGRIVLGSDADNIRVDSAGEQLVVGYGNGALAIIDVMKGQKVGTIRLKAHPESFQLSADGKIFVNVPGAREIAVIDRASRKQTASWSMPAGGNFPMALDETAQRVLTVFRSPARLGIFSMADGRTVSLLETCGDADDVFANSKRHRVYVACGSGALDVFDAGGSDYRRIARIPTVAGARTALFIAELDKLVLAARATSSEPASLWLFRPAP